MSEYLYSRCLCDINSWCTSCAEVVVTAQTLTDLKPHQQLKSVLLFSTICLHSPLVSVCLWCGVVQLQENFHLSQNTFNARRRVLASARATKEHVYPSLFVSTSKICIPFILHTPSAPRFFFSLPDVCMNNWRLLQTWSDMLDVQPALQSENHFDLSDKNVIWKSPPCISLTFSLWWFASGGRSSFFLLLWFECEEEVREAGVSWLTANFLFCPNHISLNRKLCCYHISSLFFITDVCPNLHLLVHSTEWH